MKSKGRDIIEGGAYDIFPVIDAGHGQLEYADLVQRIVADLLKGGAFLRNGMDAQVGLFDIDICCFY